MTDLAQLIGRLKAASEGSRPLDWLIAEEIGDEAFRLKAAAWPPFAPGSKIDKGIPAFTTSLDAIVALIERKLPGWTVARLGQNDDKTWHAELREGYLTSYDRVATSSYRPGSRPATPALALCIAFLRALQAQQETQE